MSLVRTRVNLLGLLILLPLVTAAAKDNAGSIRCEIWHDVPGGQLTDTLENADLERPAGETKSLPSFELNPAPEDQQACALRGYLIPPVTGDYKFELSGDDTAALYLSKDQSTVNPKLIATVPSCTGVRDFKHYTAQTSTPIHLLAKKKYFVEALLKNLSGASHVSVGWFLPDGTEEAPIPGTRLSPATGNVPMPSADVEPPKMTLKPEPKPDLSFGFHKFPLGAHVERAGEALDMSYLLFFPARFGASSEKRPLLIFLHGNGHQGTDLEGCLNEGPSNYLQNDKNLRDWFPMVGLFPQLPGDWRWDRPGAPQMVNALINAVCEKYPKIDRKRIYLTGLSMGGKGTWLTALDSPKTFAAVTTISAVAVRPTVAKTKLAGLRNLHIICGADDGDFCAGSKLMYQTLAPVMGSRVQLSVIEHEGHGVWGRYYPNREIYEEFLKYALP